MANSLRKQPKVCLYEWSGVPDPGAKNENFIASRLQKNVQWWTDCGLGVFDLFYVRVEQRREVDFIIVKNDAPFMLVECKSSGSAPLNSNLFHFQRVLHAPHAFQVAFDMPQSHLMPTDHAEPVRISAADLPNILV